MKHIFRFNESFDHVQSLIQRKLQKIDREELLAKIEIAEQTADWQKVKEFTQNLKTLSEGPVLGWSNYGSLFESVQEGKSILQEIVDREIAREIEKNTESTATPEGQAETVARIREKVTEKYFGPNSNFEKIKFLLRKEPKYVPAFVRFMYVQRADYAALEDIYKKIVDFKDSLGQLPKTIDEYSKMPYESNAPEQAWGKLNDEFTKLLELRKGSWIVKALPKEARKEIDPTPTDLREAYRNAPKEEQIKLLRIAAQLDSLNKPLLVKQVRQGLSNKRNLEEIYVDIKRAVDNANTPRGQIYERAIAAYPSVRILYEDGDRYVFSFRSDSQLPYLAANARGWCIQPKWYNTSNGGMFWNYAKEGALQIVILDYTVDQSDPYHTVGVTILPNKQVRISGLCNQANVGCQGGSDFRQMLQNLSMSNFGTHTYPQELIDTIDQEFKIEQKEKSSVDAIYQRITGYSQGEKDYKQVIIKTIQGMVKDLSSLVKSVQSEGEAGENQAEKKIEVEIISTELKNLRNSPEMAKAREELIRDYTVSEKVLGNPESVKIFELFFEGSDILTPSRIDIILNKMKHVSTTLSNNLKKIPAGVNTNTVRVIKELHGPLDNAIIALEALKEKIKNKAQ